MIKQLLKSVREYKKASFLAPFYVSLEVIMEVIIPLVMAFMIDYGVNKGDMPVIVKYGAILVGLTVLSLSFGVLSGN